MSKDNVHSLFADLAKKGEYDVLLSVGAVVGVTILQQLIVVNKQAISGLVSKLETVVDADHDTLVRAEAVSDTLDVLMEYIETICESQEVILKDNYDTVKKYVRMSVPLIVATILENEKQENE